MNINTPGVYTNLVEDVVNVAASNVEIIDSDIATIRLVSSVNHDGISIVGTRASSIEGYMTTPKYLNEIHVENCRITTGAGIRLSAEAGSGGMMSGITIMDSYIADTVNGIRIFNVDDQEQVHSNLKVLGNQLYRNGVAGLSTRCFDGVEIKRNQAIGNGLTNTLGGIFTQKIYNGVIENNTSSHNTTTSIDGCGILVDYHSRDVDVIENICTDNKGSGSFNSGAGIMLLSVDNVLLYRNILKGNKYDIWHGHTGYKRSYSIDNQFDTIHYADNLPDTAEIL